MLKLKVIDLITTKLCKYLVDRAFLRFLGLHLNQDFQLAQSVQ